MHGIFWEHQATYHTVQRYEYRVLLMNFSCFFSPHRRVLLMNLPQCIKCMALIERNPMMYIYITTKIANLLKGTIFFQSKISPPFLPGSGNAVEQLPAEWVQSGRSGRLSRYGRLRSNLGAYKSHTNLTRPLFG